MNNDNLVKQRDMLFDAIEAVYLSAAWDYLEYEVQDKVAEALIFVAKELKEENNQKA